MTENWSKLRKESLNCGRYRRGDVATFATHTHTHSARSLLLYVDIVAAVIVISRSWPRWTSTRTTKGNAKTEPYSSMSSNFVQIFLSTFSAIHSFVCRSFASIAGRHATPRREEIDIIFHKRLIDGTTNKKNRNKKQMNGSAAHMNYCSGCRLCCVRAHQTQDERVSLCFFFLFLKINSQNYL